MDERMYPRWMTPGVFLKQWDTTSRIWARMVGGVMDSEQLLEINYQFIETYIRMAIDASHLVNEALFPNRRMPIHLDNVQVAKLLGSLEERVYAIEDALVNFDDGNLNVVSDHVVEGLEKRMKRVEGKLDILLAALEKIEARAHPQTILSDDGGEGIP